MYQLPDLAMLEPPDSVLTKCPTCKQPTEQMYVNIPPYTDEEINPLRLMELTKRLILCTECGTLRLIN